MFACNSAQRAHKTINRPFKSFRSSSSQSFYSINVKEGKSLIWKFSEFFDRFAAAPRKVFVGLKYLRFNPKNQVS